MKDEYPLYFKWLASIFQLIKDRNIVDTNTNETIWQKIYPQHNGVPIYNPQGRYWIKLYHFGKARKIEIDDTMPALTEKYLNISNSEIRQLHNKIVNTYKNNLEVFKVKKLWSDELVEYCSDAEFVAQLDAKELQLIFLYKYINCFVHKDLVSKFVRRYIKNAALDQQVRHLGTQYGWYVLNKGAKVPNVDETVPSGYNYLVTIESPSPSILAAALKRAGRVAARNFSEIKIAYGYKCATCGREEGKKDQKNQGTIVLQQGHMNPRLPLTLDNIIPQCQYCNQTYKDYFQFNEDGRVVAVNNPQILLSSPKDIQDEMITVLLAVRKNQA
jgi:hypothetical protein